MTNVQGGTDGFLYALDLGSGVRRPVITPMRVMSSGGTMVKWAGFRREGSMRVLSDLYNTRQKLVERFIALAKDSEDEKADRVFDMIMEVEEEISRTPVETIEDATMKLLFLRDHFDEYMADFHREAFDDIISLMNILSAERVARA
ncbi:MAG: hypothetical protein H7840_06280 [Alphaproteobacteria bacterium]